MPPCPPPALARTSACACATVPLYARSCQVCVRVLLSVPAGCDVEFAAGGLRMMHLNPPRVCFGMCVLWLIATDSSQFLDNNNFELLVVAVSRHFTSICRDFRAVEGSRVQQQRLAAEARSKRQLLGGVTQNVFLCRVPLLTPVQARCSAVRAHEQLEALWMSWRQRRPQACKLWRRSA